jgi:hypothetical protein
MASPDQYKTTFSFDAWVITPLTSGINRKAMRWNRRVTSDRPTP